MLTTAVCLDLKDERDTNYKRWLFYKRDTNLSSFTASDFCFLRWLTDIGCLPAFRSATAESV